MAYSGSAQEIVTAGTQSPLQAGGVTRPTGEGEGRRLGFGILLLEMVRADTELTAKELQIMTRMLSRALRLQAKSHLRLLLVADQLRKERAVVREATRIVCEYLNTSERRALFEMMLRVLGGSGMRSKAERRIARRIRRLTSSKSAGAAVPTPKHEWEPNKAF